MNKKNLLIAVLVASLSGNAAFVITAVARSHEQPRGDADRLTLTTQQKKRFSEANEVFLAGRAAAHRELSELRGELAAELLEETPNRERLLKVALKMSELQTARRPKLIEHLLLLHAMLSPSQRAAMADEIRSNTSACCAACPGSRFFVTQRRNAE